MGTDHHFWGHTCHQCATWGHAVQPVGPSAMGLVYALRPALLERVSEARGGEGGGWGRNQAEGGLHSPGALGTLSLFCSDVSFSGSQELLLPQGFGFLSVAMLWLPSCCVLEQVIAGDTGGPEAQPSVVVLSSGCTLEIPGPI